MKARDIAFGAILAVAGAITGTSRVHAHELRPAVLALRELSPGRFAVRWSPPIHGEPSSADPEPHFPAHCRAESTLRLDCGRQGLVGRIQFDAGATLSRVVVDIEWFQGPRELRVASGEPAELIVTGTPRRASLNQRLELFRDYATMGVKHILMGVDHLMFVVGLMLFVSSLRLLLLTITAFTLAHSITLAAAALDLVQVPSGPVELCIALSILLLGVEATRSSPTYTHRAPWVVAFVFGLLHGFGFASALAEVGLPPQHAPLALASFNIGVEAGQLISVGVLVLGWRAVVRGPRTAERARLWSALVLGIASMYWCLERAFSMWQARG